MEKLENFNPARIAQTPEEAYPPTDRPRGKDDISSVRFWIEQIKKNIWKEPVILKQGSKMTLLDGAHRIVAWSIEKKDKDIPVLFIKPKN